MKILHISDIHGDLDALKAVRDFAKKRKDLEVLVCSGDLLGFCLDENQAQRMHNALKHMVDNVKIEGQSITNVDELKEAIPFLVKRGYKAGEVYQALEKRFDECAEFQYSAIGSVFAEFPQTVLTVPGNWDSVQYFDQFGRFNIHRRTREIDGVEFSGYGEADSTPIILPPTRIIGYSDKELFNHFTNEIPEIAVTHTPPALVLDKTPEGRHLGSWGNLAYIRNPEMSSDLLLCGHVHEAGGAKKPEGLKTLVVNSGNLGRFRDSPVKGCFVEIDYEGKDDITITPYRVGRDNKVCEINGVSNKPTVSLTVGMN